MNSFSLTSNSFYFSNAEGLIKINAKAIFDNVFQTFSISILVKKAI
jgi:hypothetical protein